MLILNNCAILYVSNTSVLLRLKTFQLVCTLGELLPFYSSTPVLRITATIAHTCVFI